MNPTASLRRPRRLLALCTLCALGLLAACGDDPDEAPPPPPVADDTVPASATATPAAYVQFAASLPPDDRATARQLDGVTPPTSETAEPEPLN